MIEIDPPDHLTGTAADWFAAMAESFDGWTAAGLMTLVAAAEQLQRAEQYREAIDRDGLIVMDRFGSPKEHPAASGERAARNLFRLLVHDLRITTTEAEN